MSNTKREFLTIYVVFHWFNWFCEDWHKDPDLSTQEGFCLSSFLTTDVVTSHLSTPSTRGLITPWPLGTVAAEGTSGPKVASLWLCFLGKTSTLAVKVISGLILFRDLGIKPRDKAFCEDGREVPQICLILNWRKPHSLKFFLGHKGQQLNYFIQMTLWRWRHSSRKCRPNQLIFKIRSK